MAFSRADSPAPEPERRDHEPRVPEHLVGLLQPVALLRADDVVGRDHDVLEEDLRRVGQADAVLHLVLAGRQARRVRSTTKNVGPSGALARMVYRPAIEPFEMNCLTPLSR